MGPQFSAPSSTIDTQVPQDAFASQTVGQPYPAAAAAAMTVWSGATSSSMPSGCTLTMLMGLLNPANRDLP